MKIVVAVILAVLATGCVILPLPQAGRYMTLVDPATGQVAMQWDWAQDGICGKMGNALSGFMSAGQRLPFSCSSLSMASKLPTKATLRAPNFPHLMEMAFRNQAECTELIDSLKAQATVVEACGLR